MFVFAVSPQARDVGKRIAPVEKKITNYSTPVLAVITVENNMNLTPVFGYGILVTRNTETVFTYHQVGVISIPLITHSQVKNTSFNEIRPPNKKIKVPDYTFRYSMSN